jgi:AcrR family transcriptional regulator
MSSPTLSAKERLVVSAERMFARHGIDGVSLRQIGADAGNLNNSAVQYHFGSKDDLVQAIFEYRLGPLNGRREGLLAAHQVDDLRTWVECHGQAILEQAEQPGSHYLRFLAELQRHGPAHMLQPPGYLRIRIQAFHDRLYSLLDHLDEPLRRHRIAHAEVFIVQAGAHREQQLDDHTVDVELGLAIADLTESMVAFLLAAGPSVAAPAGRSRAATG